MNIDLVRELIEMALLHHHCVEDDRWYSCPLAPGGCSNDTIDPTTCNCGTDAHNARVREIAAELQIQFTDHEH